MLEVNLAKMNIEKLTNDKEAAAQLIATGGIGKQDIAEQLGIHRNTLWKWEQDDNFKARVGELKQEFEGFAKDLIQSKLVNAVNDYWKLINSTENARVKADGYRFFIQHQLGTPESKSKVELTTSIENTTNIDDDLLETAYDDVIDYEDVED